MKSDRTDELMGNALRAVDPVPPTPREEIWARIQAERAGVAAAGAEPVMSAAGDAGVIDLHKRRRRSTWLAWSAAVAATLVLGIGLGRVSVGDAPQTAAAPAVDAPRPGAAEAGGAAPVPAAYRLAATNHLERTETLLASLAVDGRAEPGQLSDWARELLTDTRLLLSSPAADDAVTRRLLEDLELILTQIAGIPESRATEEVELIHAGINQSDVLLRLRAATAGPRLVGT